MGSLGGLLSGSLAQRVLLVAVGILVFLLLWQVARWLRGRLEALLRRRNAPPELIMLSSRAGYVALLVVAAFILFAFVLAQADVALAGVVLATIVAGLGLQDILRNYVSGIYIVLERNIRVGDHIEFDGKLGAVTEVRLRVTYLRGPAGELVVVPNAELFNTTVVVRSARGGAPEKPSETPRDQSSRDRPATDRPGVADPS